MSAEMLPLNDVTACTGLHACVIPVNIYILYCQSCRPVIDMHTKILLWDSPSPIVRVKV